MTRDGFLPGIDTLLKQSAPLLRGRRLALLSHPAALGHDGRSGVSILSGGRNFKLVRVFGPEHGFFGASTAGEIVPDMPANPLNVPIISLYGSNRKPTAAMLKGIDTIVVDLQDLSARPYTYISSLRYVLEAAAEYGKSVIVTDRPVPLPNVIDGPLLAGGHESFVAMVPFPVSYGMTEGEAARLLKSTLKLDVELHVAPMKGYRRDAGWQPCWPEWIPPSPGIRSWECAVCYTSTVWFEALPAVDYGRGTALQFRVFGATWIKAQEVCEFLQSQGLPGVSFHRHPYYPAMYSGGTALLNGVRMHVADHNAFRPVRTGIAIIHCLQKLYGKKRLWQPKGTRPEFFDKLMGCSDVRTALLDGDSPETITARWDKPLRDFQRLRKPSLIYKTA